MDLVSIKGTALWHFEDMGQTCTLTSCRAHALSSGQDRKCGYLDKAVVFFDTRFGASVMNVTSLFITILACLTHLTVSLYLHWLPVIITHTQISHTQIYVYVYVQYMYIYIQVLVI